MTLGSSHPRSSRCLLSGTSAWVAPDPRPRSPPNPATCRSSPGTQKPTKTPSFAYADYLLPHERVDTGRAAAAQRDPAAPRRGTHVREPNGQDAAAQRPAPPRRQKLCRSSGSRGERVAAHFHNIPDHARDIIRASRSGSVNAVPEPEHTFIDPARVTDGHCIASGGQSQVRHPRLWHARTHVHVSLASTASKTLPLPRRCRTPCMHV